MNDHRALVAAAREHEHVLPVFVLDDALLSGSAGTPNRRRFLRESLTNLHESLSGLGSGLTVRRGEPAREAIRLARRHGLDAIHMSSDHSPHARRRDREIAAACGRERIELRRFGGITAVEPGALAPAGSEHYRVFTPYWRVWSSLARAAPERPPGRLRLPAGARASPERAISWLGRGGSEDLAAGGETAARRMLKRWLTRGVDGYGEGRDDLAHENTSRLSAHLHFGTISAGEILARLPAGPGPQGFARQLCWRDFHHQVLAACAVSLGARAVDYRPRGDRWRRDTRSAQAWMAGMTGYPIVDAGMRQLAREGFMHNRARMIVASFLTKTLYIDWRVGAAHFASLLADADVACNTGNWQWVAGTGNDTRPNRILNPLRQAHRLDPDGEYVRRYVPELEALPGASVHEPWLLPERERRTLRYPERGLRAVAAGEARRQAGRSA